MHYALAQSLPKAEVVCAFDINTVANDVYEHNHGVRPYQVMRVIFTFADCVMCCAPVWKSFTQIYPLACQLAAMHVHSRYR